MNIFCLVETPEGAGSPAMAACLKHGGGCIAGKPAPTQFSAEGKDHG
ncbi:hypothetical protein KVG96_24140 [Pseudomonas sp. COR58]|uniref:Uncharacterized protein n=1 Tax=Pseudomonas ekonensis TaxID=2842353 RepID=A0ABS6PLZ0_9PSED|nr:hypothetical protein [Pseudomonas ekonensis]MBV4461057.1 hypothetical protein [Pseudomonas ekonensis]